MHYDKQRYEQLKKWEADLKWSRSSDPLKTLLEDVIAHHIHMQEEIESIKKSLELIKEVRDANK